MGNNPSDLFPSAASRESPASSEVYVSRDFDKRLNLQLQDDHSLSSSSDTLDSPTSSGVLDASAHLIPTYPRQLVVSPLPERSPRSSVHPRRHHPPPQAKTKTPATFSITAPSSVFIVSRERLSPSSSVLTGHSSSSSSPHSSSHTQYSLNPNNSQYGVAPYESKRNASLSDAYSGSINDEVLAITKPGVMLYAEHHLTTTFKRRGDKW